jgi:hypothetical protein
MSGLSPEAGTPRPLLLAQTSLQLVLAAALAESARCAGRATAGLLFVPDLVDPELLQSALHDWAGTPFAHVQFVSPRRSVGSSTKTSWKTLNTDLIDAIRSWQPTSITVFNDRQDAGQRALIEAQRHFPQAQRLCAEDGALAYTGYTYRRTGFITRCRQHLRFGRHWSDVRVLGTHPLVQAFLALHPHLLRPELRSRPVRPFPAEQLSAPSLRELAHHIALSRGWAPSTLRDGTALLALNHSSYAKRNPGYAALVTESVNVLRSLGIPCLFKYHPREADPDYLGLTGTWPNGEVPRSLPMELVFLLCRERRMLVLGGVGTSVLTAALLLPQARCAALAPENQKIDQWTPALTSALGIHMLADAPAIANLLQGWNEELPLRRVVEPHV